MKTGFITMKNMSTHVGAVCAAALLVGLTSCRKDLCYDHTAHAGSAKAQVQSSWECEWERDYGRSWQENWPDEYRQDYEELYPGAATGIAAFVYHEDGSSTEQHLPAEGGELPMTPGTKKLLFYNDDTRYIVFNDLNSWATAAATTRTRTRVTYSETHADEQTINTPDMLYGEWIEEHEAKPTVEPTALPITMRPLVYTYLVRYEFDEGAEHVALARGALSGMAQAVYLQDGHTSDEVATLLYDCELTDYGVEAQVTSFGVPSTSSGEYTTRADARFGLNLEVMLANGTMKTFDFDVTDQLADQPRGGVITVKGLKITDEEAAVNGGFEVDIDGWGDYEDIEVPLD